MKSPASVDDEGANVDQTECQGCLAGLKVMDKLHIYKTNLAGEVSNFVSIGFDPKQQRWAKWLRGVERSWSDALNVFCVTVCCPAPSKFYAAI